MAAVAPAEQWRKARSSRISSQAIHAVAPTSQVDVGLRARHRKGAAGVLVRNAPRLLPQRHREDVQLLRGGEQVSDGCAQDVTTLLVASGKSAAPEAQASMVGSRHRNDGQL